MTLHPDTLHLDEDGGFVTLKVRASPGASRDRIVGVLGDALKIAVSAAPEKGRANKRILRLLADALGLAPRDLAVVGGEASRDKRVRIAGLSSAELCERLKGLLS